MYNIVMLKRKIEEKILQWYNTERHKVLFIDGPRQVGKSFIIQKLGKEKFKNFVEFNFIEESGLIPALSGIKSFDEFILKLSAIKDLKDDSDETLIFLDEIQELEEVDIISLIKFISIESKRCFAISGSLLGVSIKNYKSWPLGYIYSIEMNSLDFEEFMWAFNVSLNVINHLKESFECSKEVDPLIHEKMSELFSLYIILGGMPEVIEEYIRSKSFTKCDDKLKQINNYYEKDVSKYQSLDSKLYIEEIYNLIPSELNNKNKRFILKNLNEYTKFNKYDSSFIWLNKAGVTITTYNVSSLSIPLMISKERTLFKLFSYDTGLLINQFNDPTLKIKVLNKTDNINFGSIYENVIAKELYVHGYKNLFYYNSKKHGELDFVIEDKGKVIPIEVKSGKDYDIHHALNNVFDIYSELEKGYVFYNGNVQVKGKVIYLPLYMIMYFDNQKEDESLDDLILDFSALSK